MRITDGMQDRYRSLNGNSAIMKNIVDNSHAKYLSDGYTPSPPAGDSGRLLSSELTKMIIPENEGPLWKASAGDFRFKSFICDNKGSLYTGSHDRLIKINPENGQTLWETQLPAELDTFPAKAGKDGALYVSTADGCLRRIDPESGEEKWNFDMKLRGGAPLIGHDGTVYTKYDDDTFALTSEGNKKWRFRINDYMHTIEAEGPDSTLYIASDRGIHAIKPNGFKKWNSPLEGYSCHVMPDGRIYAYKYNDSIVSLDPGSGKENWRLDIGEAFVKAGKDGTLYLENSDSLSAIDPKDGHTLWNQDMGNNARICAISGDGTLIVGSGDKHIQARSGSDGHILWEYDMLQSSSWGDASIDSKGILFINDNRYIYALDTANRGELKFLHNSQGTVDKCHFDAKNSTIYYTRQGPSDIYAVRYEDSSDLDAKKHAESDDFDTVETGAGFIEIGSVRLPVRK